MISEKQLEANRRNAQYSTGPRTAEGKAVVAANALRHGFRSQRIVIDGESTADYDDFHNDLVAQLAPVGVLETILTDRVAAGFWRLQRAGRMEAEMLELMQSSECAGKNDPAAADLRQTAAQLKRLIESRIADSGPRQPQPVRRLPWQGFDGALAAWKATPEGQRYVYGTWPDDPAYPSPNESFSAFMRASRESADPYAYDPAFDHGPALPQDAPAAAAAVDPGFTEQTHLDASPDTPPTADPAADPPGDTAADGPVFAKQTHCDHETSLDDPPAPEMAPANARPARSLGDVIAADLRGPNTILKLNRYEAHIERSLFKTFSELERLQQRRLARETAAPEPIDTELIANG